MPPRVSSVSTDGLDGAQHRQQRVGEHGVRHAASRPDTRGHGDGESPLRRLFGERGDEVRLADAALADDEERSARDRRRRRQRGGERGQLRRAPPTIGWRRSESRHRGGR